MIRNQHAPGAYQQRPWTRDKNDSGIVRSTEICCAILGSNIHESFSREKAGVGVARCTTHILLLYGALILEWLEYEGHALQVGIISPGMIVYPLMLVHMQVMAVGTLHRMGVATIVDRKWLKGFAEYNCHKQ